MSQRMFEAIVRVRAKGQITIPKKLLETAGLKEGDFVRATVEKGRIILEPVRILPYQKTS